MTQAVVSYSNLQRVSVGTSLRSISGPIRLQVSLEKGTFQDPVTDFSIIFLIILKSVTILIYFVRAFLNS